ncbi:MAG: Glu-tRNA(Gln) amidotransferase subunit GatE [Candidatus Aenigmatarchaeota archaeon]
MNSQDFYENIGFKCGLEIHVQLNTERKLFCSCPNRRSAELPIKIERKIRPSAGELGKMDPAALHEFLRGRSFSYAINRETACLVETDDEPPHEINREALEISLSVAKSFGCAVPDEIIVMRKAVADGSAVSGFQRTALVGLNGKMETESGKVRISSLSLEEDSATPIAGNGIEYRLDRLGVPLIEIGTEPDIKNPEHARQVAEKIGMLLFEKRQRGIGAIRQDLNVSIKGGARVEIKGVQDIDSITTIIENEIKRQQSLLEIKSELLAKKSAAGKLENATGLMKNTGANFIQKTLKEGGVVYAGALKGFAGLMKKDCGGRTFGKELSSYAGAFGLGIIHSDETEKFPFLAPDFAALRKELSAGADDLIFIVAGKGAERASMAVMQRAMRAMKGVPEETRAANPDGTTSYLRPLPGAGRMYPETDVPPIKITKEFLGKIRPPKSADEKLRELEKILPKQMAAQMLRSEYLGLFEKLTAESKKYDPTIVANILLSVMKDLKRKGIPVEDISETDVEKIFHMEKNKTITKDSIPDMLEAASKGIPMEETAGESGRIADGELRNIVRNIFSKNPHLARDKKISALMGEIMKEVRGRAEGEKVMRVLKEEMDKYSKRAAER